MSVVALKYQTPTGVKTAYAFLDADGFVVRESGMKEMSAAVKAARSQITANDIKAFLDLGQACPNPAWTGLRQRYAAEMQAANAAGCTKCRQGAISRKFSKMLYEGNL